MLFVKCLYRIIEKNLSVLLHTRHTVNKISSVLQLLIQSDGKTYYFLLKFHVTEVFLSQRYLT